MTLRDQITADMLTAMKAKDEVKLSVLRLLKAAIMKFEVSGEKKKDASDEEVLALVGKEVKQRRDSVEAFKKGGREDLAAKEEEEMKILQTYLPAQMSEVEVKEVVLAVIKETGASSKADFGKVMSTVMAKVKGKTDGQTVSKLVTAELK